MTINGINIDITASDDGFNSGGTGANQNGGFGGGTIPRRSAGRQRSNWQTKQ